MRALVRALSPRPSGPMLQVLVAGALLVCSFGARRADADTITVSANFVATGFRTGAPVDPVTGTFSVTFDNDVFTDGQTAGITLSNLNIAVDARPAFFYNPDLDLLILGSTFNGLFTVIHDTNDFFLTIGHASTAPINVQLVYAQDGSAVFRGAATLTPTPIPEPSTLALAMIGVIGIALRERVRRLRRVRDCRPPGSSRRLRFRDRPERRIGPRSVRPGEALCSAA